MNNNIDLNKNLTANKNNINIFQKDKISFEPKINDNNNLNNNLSNFDSQTVSEKINLYKSSEDKNKELNSEANNISNSGETNKKVKTNDSSINNMIILKSGNIALSRKAVIEIYNLQKLNFSDNINH